MAKFVPFDQFGKTCAPASKELADTMQENPESKFAPDSPPPCSKTPCPPYWQQTCNCRVNAEGLVDQEETDGCGNTRWVRIAGKVVWTDVGEPVCDDTINRFKQEQINQCGDTRLVTTANYCCTSDWQDTSELDCLYSMLRIEQEDGCGNTRLVNTGQAVTWVDNAGRRCQDGSYQRSEQNQCGDLRWTPIGSLSWADTGNTRCSGALIEKEQLDQCGNARWIATNLPAGWVDTSTVTCVADVYSVQQVNECGETRMQARGAVIWSDTGLERCSGTDMTEKKQVNQCGGERWVETGAICGTGSGLAPLEFNGQVYEASRSYSHNVSARVQLFIRADGTWDIEQSASPGGGSFTGTPTAGNWHLAPVAGVGAGFEVSFDGEGTILDAYTNYEGQTAPVPVLSPDTGWLPLTTDRSVQVYTGHMTDGRGDAGGSIEVMATYTVKIRPIGGGTEMIATLDMSAFGFSDL